MPIDLVCEDCSTKHRFKDSAAGKSVTCKRCGALLTVPEVATEGAAFEMPSDGQCLDLEGMLQAAKSEVPTSPADARSRSWFEYLALVLMIAVVAVPLFQFGMWAVRELQGPHSDSEWKLTASLLVVLGSVAILALTLITAAVKSLTPPPSIVELRTDPNGSKFSMNSIVCTAYDRGHVAVIVDRDARMIHFKKSFMPSRFVMFVPAWWSCSLDAITGLNERSERHRGLVLNIETAEGFGSIKATASNYAELRRYLENPGREPLPSAPPMLWEAESLESALVPETQASPAESKPRQQSLTRETRKAPKTMRVRNDPAISGRFLLCLLGGIVGPIVGLWAFSNKLIPDPGVAIFGGILLGACLGLPFFLVSPRDLGRLVGAIRRSKYSGGLLGGFVYLVLRLFIPVEPMTLLVLMGAGTALGFVFARRSK